ncbi:MAG: hypothetical protein K2M16_10800, partial [Muribaculaceae bacterium]|nr:hypothetical protein [Muribaculaceae bacterium]
MDTVDATIDMKIAHRSGVLLCIGFIFVIGLSLGFGCSKDKERSERGYTEFESTLATLYKETEKAARQGDYT